MIRLFVAIDFPAKIKKQLAGPVDILIEEGYPLVFEKEENLHLTLKFLGWINDKKKLEIGNWKLGKLDEIKKTVEKATNGVKPFWLKPGEFGYFLKESLILWVGVEAQEGLAKLVESLEEEFAKIGFAKEKREFSSHITFGKKRRATPSRKWRRIAEEIKEKFRKLELDQFKVREIVLMKSTLTPQGSIYTRLATFPLENE